MAEHDSNAAEEATTAETKHDRLEELEEAYQTYRVLKEGSEVSAQIDAIGYREENVYVSFSVSEREEFAVRLAAATTDLMRIVDLCENTDTPFSADLSRLVGEVVTLRIEDDEMRTISVKEARLYNRGLSDEGREAARANPPTLPDRLVTDVDRLRRYGRSDSTVQRVPVRSASIENDALVLELDLLGTPARWSTPVPESREIGGSVFERVVEEVGFGSVSQIEGGEFYAVPSGERGGEADAIEGAIAEIGGEVVTWLMFTDEEVAAHSEVSPETTSSEERTAGNPEDIQRGWHLGVGVAVAGWTLLVAGVDLLPTPVFGLIFLVSWPLLPLAVWRDARAVSEHVDWPAHTWLYVLGSLIWIFAVIPGAVYLVQRHRHLSGGTVPSSGEDARNPEADVLSSNEGEKHLLERTSQGEFVTESRLKKVADVLDDETVFYLGVAGSIEIERGDTSETAISLHSLERLAITDRRVVMKSKRLTGNRVWSIGYDEILDVNLKTGLVSKKLSIRTEGCTYHFQGSQPDTDEYREMVEFIQERIDAVG